MRDQGTARGTFDVTMTPSDAVEAPLGSMRLTKTWHGDLSGVGRGMMLSAGDPSSGTAGYVAVELVEGGLRERSGSMAFQQFGVMDTDGPHLTYQVVPGSGTGELAGIRGVLQLDVVEGEHHYTLDWSIG